MGTDESKGSRSRERGNATAFLRAIARLLPSGGSFHATMSKRQADRLFGNRVDIPVPEMGLGRRLNWMREWCRERMAPESWSMHSHQALTSAGRAHVVRFYFAFTADAEAFSREWGRAWTPSMDRSPSVIARAQAALSARLGAEGQGLYAF